MARALALDPKVLIVELGDARTICTAPSHLYTKALISAVPYPDPRTPRMKSRVRYTEATA